jgi:hypothetical protein
MHTLSKTKSRYVHRQLATERRILQAGHQVHDAGQSVGAGWRPSFVFGYLAPADPILLGIVQPITVSFGSSSYPSLQALVSTIFIIRCIILFLSSSRTQTQINLGHFLTACGGGRSGNRSLLR